MDSETINAIVEARRGSEKLALVKQENVEEYLRDMAGPQEKQ